jgi:DNA-binding NarL/FixJ family response regulator
MSAKTSQTKILIIDDHPILRSGITQVINQQKDLIVCGEVGDASKALRAIEMTQCQLVILDISLSGTSGIEILKDIKVQHPKLPVLMLSMHDESVYAQRALRAGASGYVMKHEATEKLILAIRKVLAGEVYLSEKLSAQLLQQIVGGTKSITASPVEALSDRELEVFTLIGQGHGTRPIAERLHLSVKTIESHRAHIKEKLNLKTGVDLMHHAIQWVQSGNLGKGVAEGALAEAATPAA